MANQATTGTTPLVTTEDRITALEKRTKYLTVAMGLQFVGALAFAIAGSRRKPTPTPVLLVGQKPN